MDVTSSIVWLGKQSKTFVFFNIVIKTKLDDRRPWWTSVWLWHVCQYVVSIRRSFLLMFLDNERIFGVWWNLFFFSRGLTRETRERERQRRRRKLSCSLALSSSSFLFLITFYKCNSFSLPLNVYFSLRAHVHTCTDKRKKTNIRLLTLLADWQISLSPSVFVIKVSIVLNRYV